MLTVEAVTADDAWVQLLELIRMGKGTLQPGRREPAHELLHVAMSIREPRNRWVTSRHPPLNPAFAIAELIWILNGHNDSKFLTYWNRRLPEFAGESATFHGAYGYRLRHHLGLDQLERAARALRSSPSTRQVVLQIWDGTIDLPLASGAATSPDIPCNLVSILKVREGRLDWFQVLRSNDLYLGLPHNFLQFMTLQEIMAGWIGVEVGEYNQISDSLHIYESDYAVVMESVQQPPASNTDVLLHSLEESRDLLSRVDRCARALTEDGLEDWALRRLIDTFQGPEGFRNWAVVLGAESARRRGWAALSDELMNSCTNPALTQLWRAWTIRVGKQKQADPV